MSIITQMPIAERKSCAHCGLPVLASGPSRGERYYCCYGCYLVSGIVGRQDGQGLHAWDLLRLGVGTFLSMDVMMIALLLYTGSIEPTAESTFRWIMFAMAAPAMAILGYPFVLGAISEVRRGRLSLDTLIAVGSTAAFAASAVNTIRGQGHVYFDTATMLPALVTFGKLIEAGAKSQAGKLLGSLQSLLPTGASRIDADGLQRNVPLDALRTGDVLRIKPGERFPVDGTIIDGATTVHEAAFTGEAAPRTCRTGDNIFGGSVNGEGSLLVQATQTDGEMLLRRIVTMVEQARGQTSRTERIAETISAVFVPVTLTIALAAGLYWLLAADGGWWRACSAALAVLVVACPCAMGIATPLATAMAIARAARSGAVVKGGDVMERIGLMRRIFLDKTGTLTQGRAALRSVETDDGVNSDELLKIIAGLETASEHVLARTIMAAATSRGLSPAAVTDVHISPGEGISGIVQTPYGRHRVFAGREKFVNLDSDTDRNGPPSGEYAKPKTATIVPISNISISNCGLNNTIKEKEEERGRDAHDTNNGETVVYVAWDGKLRGRLTFTDKVRPGAAEMVRDLKKMSIEPVLITGDNAASASSLADAVGIAGGNTDASGKIFSSIKPDEKIRLIQAARDGGTVVAMVGDGINDAPALAVADVGIALGGGTDLAGQAGNVVLVSDNLSQIPWLVRLSRHTRRIIKQNLFWALGYNTVALAAAACGVLHPLLAAVAMVVSSLTVLSNSIRASRFPEEG